MGKRFCSVILLLWAALSAYSQTAINDIIAPIDTFSNRLPAEKLYLHFDKPYYSTGDTIWLKAYLFDATFLTASQKSGLVYIELANDTNKVLLRRMLPLYAGLGRGNIPFSRDNIPEGSYTIRAYTNWMRNFGEDHVFKKSIYVSGSSAESWLVNSTTKFSGEGGKENIRMGLQFRTLDKKAIGLRELQVRVMEGKRTLFRDKVQTDVDGLLDVNFDLPEKADPKNISILAEDAGAPALRKISIPVAVNRPGNIDLQFMPEGGSLVAGIPARVGFKAIGEDGKGVSVSGSILNGSGSEPAVVFSSLHKGMGAFYLLPRAGEKYTASITLSDGTTKNYPLPEVKTSGTALSVRNKEDSDSLEISVLISPSLLPDPATAAYYLIGQYGSIVCYAATIRSNIRIKVSKKLFPSGIAHFTLFSQERKPLNERITYIDHHDQLNITITPDKASYKIRDSISLDIEVKDKEGKPVRGTFSLAVTDDSQVKTDSLQADIRSSILLTSDVKGTVEDPGYYFNSTNEAWEALDNLLLTQGWIGYNWEDIFDPNPATEYPAEKEFTVKGKVVNLFNKPLGATHIMLISTKPLFFKDLITSDAGEFSFSQFPRLDSAAFRIQANNKRDKSFNVSVTVDEFTPPEFGKDEYQTIPWYMNTDTALLNYVKSNIAQKQEEMKLAGKNVLETVSITAKKIVTGSKNLNGEGAADLTLDENDMKKAGKKNLLQLLQESIPKWMEIVAGRAFPINVFYGAGENLVYEGRYYAINGVKANIIIDGMELDFYYVPSENNDDYYNYIRNYLEYFSAEDIMGVELMKPGEYTKLYNNNFKVPVTKPGIRIARLDGRVVTVGSGLVPQIDTSQPFIEITTRSGQGPLSMPTPGSYLFKTMPFTGTKQFYSPKYSVKDKPFTLTDLRSTIHWAPDVITDQNGKASLTFYSADRPGTYTILTEGSDMNGRVGVKRAGILVR